MDSILRITRGIQEALNEVAVGVMDGINAAHNEAMDTIQDAILGECSEDCILVSSSRLLNK